VAVFVALLFGVAAAGPGATASQGCGISLAIGTTQINYPSAVIPPPGSVTFSQILDVNYSSGFTNSTLVVEYLNASTWKALGTFQGNAVGFTEVSYGLDRSWVHFGSDVLRVQNGACTSNPSSFSVSYDPSAALVDVAIYAGLILLVFVFLFAGKKLGWKRFLVVAIPIYLMIAPFTGQRYDVYFLLSSGIRLLQHVNPFEPGTPPAYPGPLKWAYPPLYPVYSAFSFLVYQALTGSALPSVMGLTWPGWLTSTYNIYEAYVPSSLPVLVFLLKLHMVLSALLTGHFLKRMTGDPWAAIWWVANPLVILIAVIWGQLDPISTVLVIASLFYFQKGKANQAYLLASLGAAVKVWPVLLIPLMLVVDLRKRGPRALRPLLWCLPPVLVTAGLYAAYGNLVNSLFVLLYARGIPTFSGAFTVNGLTWQEVLVVLKSPPVPLFLLVGIPAYLACYAWVYFKRETDVVKWLIVSILILFLTYNYVNPQYFYWLVPLLILQKRKWMALLFTVLPLIYVILSYDLFYFVSPAFLPDQFALGASVADQIKLNFFYQSTWLFILVGALIPTLAYVWAFLSEVRARGSPAAISVENL